MVIGIAGSDEKCAWLVDYIGFDVALNYKSRDFEQRLHAATPDLINVYWDNGEFYSLKSCPRHMKPMRS